jgi:Raf kinase inhibitor-like YbhB/YbcL family protein
MKRFQSALMRFCLILSPIALLLIPICGPTASHAAQTPRFSLSSPAFVNSGIIPTQYTCNGANESPPLSWSGAPKRTISFALIVRDPDAGSGDFIHWLVFNIPASATQLAAHLNATDPPQGVNSLGRVGYHGPCPPPGPPHHYHFQLIALDSSLNLKPGATVAELEAAASKHQLEVAELIGIFSR